MFSPKSKDKLGRYEDPLGGMSGKDLRRAEWLLRHKPLLYRIGLGVLILWCIGTIGYSVWQWGEYSVFGLTRDREMAYEQLASFSNYEALHARTGAMPIELSDFSVYRSGEDQYDFVAMAVNPNAAWKATLTYYVDYGQEKTDNVTTVLLPGERRPIAIFGHKSQVYPADARLMLDDTGWQRVNPHDIPDPAAFMAERLRFAFDTVRFGSPQDTLATAPRVQFDLHNMSSYSYWQPEFYVELLSGSQPVGLLYVSLDGFRAGETRPVEIGLFGDTVNVTDLVIYPVLDVFDPKVYMLPT